MEYTKTELHTHLMGMLSAEAFLNIAREYTDFIYWPLDKPIGNDTTVQLIDDILKDKTSVEQLRIKHGEQVDYDKLNNFYISRISLFNFLVLINYFTGGQKKCSYKDIKNDSNLKDKLNQIIDNNNYPKTDQWYLYALMEYIKMDKDNNKEKYADIQKDVFNYYVNRSLEELINMDIDYVEISYSYEKLISSLEIDPNIKDKIKCKFLLSTSRDKSIKEMKKSAHELEVALEKGMTVGFDIMGQEIELTDIEKTYSISNQSKSFKRKLEILTEVLLKGKNDNNVLRIHSGETKTALKNTEWILDTLKEIKEEYNKNHVQVFPPPELRIGHGIYFIPNNNYEQSLKELNAIIEINASSNLALNNIGTYEMLPYDYYLSRNIPVVTSTDGHGLYDTTKRKEDQIAYITSENYDSILKYDQQIIERKR